MFVLQPLNSVCSFSGCFLMWPLYLSKHLGQEQCQKFIIFRVFFLGRFKGFSHCVLSCLSRGVQPLIYCPELGMLQVWIGLGKINLDELFCRDKIFILLLFLMDY